MTHTLFGFLLPMHVKKKKKPILMLKLLHGEFHSKECG